MRDFHLPGRSAVMATNGICATSHPLAAEAAIGILKEGGNAMDAAIAGAVLLGLAEPAMTGIGGDLFALVSPGGGDDIVAVNGSGRAPAAARADTLRAAGHETIPLADAAAITVPGAMDAFCAMSERWGKRGLADSLQPAIHYMSNGLPVAARVGWDWQRDASLLQGHGRTHFLRNGTAYRTGDMFALPGQAEVLRRVAAQGRDGFYKGEVADDMLSTLQAMGGVHTEDDFANVACSMGDAISGTYQGRTLFEHPPNTHGATAILMLNILAEFDLAALAPFGAARTHLEAETAKLAYDARNRFIGDPDHTTRLEHMLSPETAKSLAGLINPKVAMAGPSAAAEAVHKDTIYLTVVDKDRMVVSLIYSIFHSFGSGAASEKFGILFQNRGAGFTLQHGHANEYAGGKRPMHTIIPAMLCDAGRVTMPFGVMGGQYQPSGHARVVANMTDFAMDAQTALDAPRSFADAGILKLERGYGADVRQTLADMGHEIVTPDVPLGGAQSIVIHDNGVLEGASDPRKDGAAIGY